MEDPITFPGEMSTTVAEEQSPAAVNPCEQCGWQESRYVVADLQERDTSLFCPACIVLTFAKVASEIGAQGS